MEVGKEVAAWWVTGRVAPLPTVMGAARGRGRREWRLPEEPAMCDVAPVSRNHSEELEPAGGTPALARAARRALWSQTPCAGTP